MQSMILAGLALGAPSQVLDVDAAQGPYTEVQDAIDAALEGDIIRVAAGTYGGFWVVSKSLTVVGEPGTVVEGKVRVHSLGAGQDVVVRGIEVPNGNAAALDERGIYAYANDGPVRFEEVRTASDAGINALDCDDLSLVECGLYPGSYRSPLQVEQSMLTVTGGAYLGVSGWGGLGAQLSSVNAWMSGVQIIGGEGSWCPFNATSHCQGGDGGDGLSLLNSTLLHADLDLRGGLGGWGPGNFGTGNGRNGEPLRLTLSTAIEALVGHKGLNVPSLNQDASPMTVTVTGRAGDVVFLFLSSDSARTRRPGIVGEIHLAAPLIGPRINLGVIGASGTLTGTVVLPDLAPFETERWYAQALHWQTSGEFVIGNVRAVTILDAAW